MRTVALLAAGTALAASTATTWYGVLAVVLLVGLLLDAQRRVREAFERMDGIDDKIDAQTATIEALRSRVEGDDVDGQD